MRLYQYLLAQLGNWDERRLMLNTCLQESDIPGDIWKQTSQLAMRAGHDYRHHGEDKEIFKRALRGGGFKVQRGFNRDGSFQKLYCSLTKYSSPEDAKVMVSRGKRLVIPGSGVRVIWEREITSFEIPESESSWVYEQCLEEHSEQKNLRVVFASLGCYYFVLGCGGTNEPWQWEFVSKLCRLQMLKLSNEVNQ